MAKGENLEKPKKGGMVIVIGVGAKPKKDKTAMKKAESRRAPRRRGSSQDNQRARIHAFKQKLRNDPYHLEELLEEKGIPIDSFEEHFHDKHGKSLDEAIEDGSVDVPQAIEEAQRIIRGNEGQFRDGKPNPNLARLLERRRINPNSFQQSLLRDPFMEFQERINSLAERAAQNRAEERRDDERHEPQELDEQEAPLRIGGRQGAVVIPERDSRTHFNENDLDNLTRLLSARYPEEIAEQMAARYMMQGFHFSPTEHEFNVSMQNQPDDDDPTVAFSAQHIGAATPKKETANPRVLNDPRSTRAGQGEGMLQRPFQMQTSFDNPLNVMDEAWALLKGNPSMRDAQGLAINHPAAMVYDDLAAQIHLNEQNPFDPRHDNPDDESAADRMEEMRNPTHQRKLMRRMRQQGKPFSSLLTQHDAKMARLKDRADQNRLRQMRQEAREQTRNTMDFGNDDDSPSPNYGVQQSTGTNVQMIPKKDFPFQYDE